MGLLNKLLRVRTLVIAAIIAVICAAAYYITACKSINLSVLYSNKSPPEMEGVLKSLSVCVCVCVCVNE